MSNEIEIQVAVEMKRVTRESKCTECGKLFRETSDTMFKKAFSDTPICDECRNEIIEKELPKKVVISKKCVKTLNLDCDDFSSLATRFGVEYTKIELDKTNNISEYSYTNIDESTFYAYERCYTYGCYGLATVVKIYREKLTLEEALSIDWSIDWE